MGKVLVLLAREVGAVGLGGCGCGGGGLMEEVAMELEAWRWWRATR